MDEKTKRPTHRTLGNDTTSVSGIDYERRLWEPFKKTCCTVLREFGFEPITPADELPPGFRYTRDAEHAATITFQGDGQGGMVEFSIRLTAPHTYGYELETGGRSFYAGPDLQNFGRSTELALALMLALRPIAFGKFETHSKHRILECVGGLYTAGYYSTAGHGDDVAAERS